MMRIHRITVVFTAILFCAVSPLVAADYGLELMNNVGVTKMDDAELFTEHKATLWGTIPFDNGNTRSLAVEGSFYASRPAGIDEFEYYLDIDLLRFSVTARDDETGMMLFDVGRFPVSDITGKILNQGMDGFNLELVQGFGNLAFFAGYTGLLNARQEETLMTVDDSIDAATDDIYALGAQRVVGKAVLHIPELFAGTDLLFQAMGQYDLRDQLDPDAAEIMHTVYGTVMLTGAVNPALFYTVSGTFQTGILDSDDTYSLHSILAVGRLDYYPVPATQVYTEILYTSGEDSFFSHFQPITSQDAGTLYAGGYSNIIRGTAGVSYNSMDMLNLDGSIAVFLYPQEVDGFDGLYTATEINVGATFRATSDLRMRGSGALLFPKDEDMTYQAELKVIFNL